MGLILSNLFIIVVERIIYSTKGNETIKVLNFYEPKHSYSLWKEDMKYLEIKQIADL